MAKLFFLLSGEHKDLPAAELKAILEAESYTYRVLEKLDQVLRVEAEPRCIEALTRRAALTRACGLELLSCKAEMNEIIKALRNVSLAEALQEKESFVVRVKRVRNYASDIDTISLERKIGELVQSAATDATVNLRNPDKTFFGVLTDEKLVFGVKLAEIPAKPFVERRPRKKPFFHPSAMQAKLARCMVNLAEPKAGEIVVDPFCGTGSMLTEASLIGCRALGLDIQRRMARGTLRNLAHFSIKPEGVIVSDARSLPLKKIDCVVTDPPYGISSTTLKRNTGEMVKELLTEVREMLDRGRRICIASPKTLKIGEIGEESGYRHLESHLVYVHRSLTREIAVFEKV